MLRPLLVLGIAALVAMNVAMAATLTCTSFVGGSLQYGCQITKSNFYVGPGDEWPGAPNFLVMLEDRSTNDPGNLIQGGTGKTFARSLIVADKGDAPEIAIREAGPDNSQWTDWAAAPVEPGKNLGTIYWQAFGKTSAGTNGWWTGNGNNGRQVSLYARSCGQMTAQNRAGEFYIATSQLNNPGNPVPRINVNCDGKIRMNFGGSWKTLSVSNGFVKAN